MRKWAFCFSVGLVLPLWSENQATQIHFNDDSSVAIQASYSNLNRLFVKDDQIIQHIAPQGTFIFNKRQNKDGSVYFKPIYPNQHFSVFFTTKKGHHFSALISSVGQDGKTVEMVPNNTTKAQQHWEKNTGYLKLLQQFMRGMIKGEAIHGVTSETLTQSKPFNGYPNTSMQLTQVYQGGQLQGFVYKITNTSAKPLALAERKFWRPHVRAVSLSEHTLAPQHTGFVYSILSVE